MLRNYLTESGTLTCIQGNDAYAPLPYWDTYSYRSLTTNELNALKNNAYNVTAFTLASGQYTCLEVTVSGSIFLGALRCYFGNNVGNYITAGLAIEQPTDLSGETATSSQLIADGSRNPSTTDAIPVMVSNTSPSPFVASASSYYDSGFEPYRLFDKDPYTCWSAAWGVGTGWVKIDCGTSKIFNKYRFLARYGAYNYPPNTWTLKGSNDGSSWTTLDSQVNFPFVSMGNWSAWITFVNSTAYRYYMIDITLGYSTSSLNIAELHFVEATGNDISYGDFPPYVIPFSFNNYLEVEDIKGPIAYWKRIGDSTGYFESDIIPFLYANPVTLVSADHYTTSGIDLPLSSDVSNKSYRQIIRQPSDMPQSEHIRLNIIGASDGGVSLSHVAIAPIDVTVSASNFDYSHVQDHAVRGRIRHWVSDIGNRGHFEGDPVYLDVGQSISGTWIHNQVWQGAGVPEPITGKQGYSIRQLLPGTQVTQDADGIQVVLQSADEDVVIRHLSYMPATSTVVKLDFHTNSSFEQLNLKGPIIRWKNDGWTTGQSLQNVDFAEWAQKLNTYVDEYETNRDTLDYLEIEESAHFGHFEGPEVDFDGGQSAIMYDANVIGFRATNHGLSPGDYISVEGTEFYDGHYIVLTYSTASIVVVWGIYDPEVFTPAAKMRKIISLGPVIDDYGVKQDARDVVPYVQVNFLNGHTAYVLNYSDYGKAYASVELSSIESNTEIVSIYDVFYDDAGYLSSAPGPSITPEYKTSMPNFSYGDKYFKERNIITRFLDLSYELDDPGRAYDIRSAEKWNGDFFVICEPQDPEFEGDWTGWGGMAKFFDRRMAQPWYTLIKDGCPWVTLCYRGQTPVKFGIDFGSPKVFSKYRLWIQLWLCPFSPSDFCQGVKCSKPKSWKFQATNTPDDEDSWVTLEQVLSYDPDLYAPSLHPLDRQIPGSCGTSDWFSYPTLKPYQYYRLYVYDVWVRQIVYGGDYCDIPQSVETSHICEMDFCEHRTAPGVFPTIVTSEIVFDKINQIVPNENMHLDSTAYYALSFDDGSTWSIYEQDHWKTIAKEDNGVWKYYRGYWRNADENNARKALWHAFSAGSNRMTANQLSSLPSSVYLSLMTSGCYPRFGIGLVSNGYLESMLDGITIYGIAYNPVGTQEPQEFLFDGQTGCTVSGGYQTLTSDWLNVSVPKDYDILIVADIDVSSGSLPRLLTGYSDYRYFERPKFVSYDEQIITVSDFTAQSGVVLLKEVDTRSSDLVIFPATDNQLEVSDWVTITGTTNYNKLYNVKYVETNRFGVTEKHIVETVVPGAYARPLVTINSTASREPDVQVGSIVEFSDTSYYTTTEYKEIAPSGLYWVTENTCQPGKEATYAFDPSADVEFHSGQSIDRGSVMIGLHMMEQRSFDSLRIQASNNYYYWDTEFPKDIEVSVSNASSPSLTNEALWTTVMSGECALPIGPKRFTEEIPLSVSGAYFNYRLKINSIYGEPNFCVRLNKLEYSDYQGSNIGYTVVDAKQGFDARYLFDGTTYSQYVSKYPMSSGVINVGINYRSKPVKITGFTLTSVKDSVMFGTADKPWRLVAPKVVSFWVSASGSPRLDVDSDWVKMTRVTYDKPGGDLPDGGQGVTGPLIEIPYSPKDSVRHTEGYTTAGNTTASVWNMSVDLSWKLDNGYVIDKIGLYSANASNQYESFKLCKNINDLNWEVVEDIGPINHPGGGFVWFTLDKPLKIPEVGDYYIGIWFIGGMNNYCSSGQSGKNFRYGWFDYNVSRTGPGVGSVQLASYNTTYIHKLAVQYMSFNDFPSSALNYKLKVESVWGGSSYNMELSGMTVETTEGYEATQVVTYSGVTYPSKLLDLPAYHKVTGLLITAVSGMQGGYTETEGNPDLTAGIYPNSFWTLVDRHWNLDNGKAIAYLGVDSDLSSSITFKIFKDSNGSGEWYDIWDIATFTHSGGGFQWFKLTNPYEVPSAGTYHLGWYQPNASRMMGDYTGAQLVSYQYGNYVGTNINLPLHSTQRPHLAVRYSTYFTVGTDGDHEALYSEFSPGTGGRQYVGGSIGPFTTASAIYLYRPATPVAPDTQGTTTYTFYYEDTRGDDYDAWPYTISGSPSFEGTHFAQHIMDGDPNTFFYSYRKLDETQHLYFMVRFDESSYINAYRLQTSASYSYYLEHFPSMITIGASSVPKDLLSSEGWDEIYFDDGFLSPRGNGALLPWVYVDDYTDFYRYFRFDMCHSNYADGYSSVGEMYLLMNQPYIKYHSVIEPYNAIKSIVGSGIDPASVEMLYHPGMTRTVQEVYNTFTYDNRSEPSPGSYFYHGENNLNLVSPTPERIFRDNPDNPEEIPFTVVEVSNSNIIAWHVMDEETGDFDDYSGNEVIGTRVGPVLSGPGKRGNAAYISDDNSDEERNVQFTLPSRLTEYTVAFWFKPAHTIDIDYDLYYDIMGGWVSYGAIPGVWHISYYQDLLFQDSPYPYLQYKDSYYMSRLVFGNYGKAIYTGRYRWPYQTWHHIAFAFKSDGSMKAWVDGASDSYSSTNTSNIYPSDSVIMVDPEDIHYTERNRVNCMYFGMPLKGSDGIKGEFSIDNIMHFNRFLSDEDVFNMYRLRYPSLEPDGIYFARDANLYIPGRTIIDFGRDVCITRAGMRSSIDYPSPGPETKWRLEALDTDLGWITLSDTYENIPPNTASYTRKEAEILVTVSGTFPKKLFQVTKEMSKLEVYVEVVDPFRGGWYSALSDPISNTGQTYLDLTLTPYTWSFAGSRSSTPGGTYISEVGFFANTPGSGLQFKLIKHHDYNTHSVMNIGASGISHPGTGMYWYHLPEPTMVPEGSSSWDLGFYCPNTWRIEAFLQNDLERTCQYAWKIGNLTGNQIGDWTGTWYNSGYSGPNTINSPKLGVRLSPYYSIRIEDQLLINKQFSASGIVSSWSGSNYFTQDSWIYMYSQFSSPDTQGQLRVRVVYYEKEDSPDISWSNFLNQKAHQYYGISIDGVTTCATGIKISSIHFGEVPIIPCVSGNYSSTLSGIETGGHDIAWILSNMQNMENIYVSLSRDDGSSWFGFPGSGLDYISPTDFNSIGSGDLSIKHTFTSRPSISGTVVYPYMVAITDWNTVSVPTEVYFGGNPGVDLEAQTISGSDYLLYTTSGDQLDMLIFDISSGKLSYTEESRWGYILSDGLTYDSSVGGDITSSGLVFLESIDDQYNEVISLPIPSSSGINDGDLLDLNDTTYSGLFTVVSASGNEVCIDSPFYVDTIDADSNLRKIEFPGAFITGSYLGFPEAKGIRVTGTEGYLGTISQDMGSSDIESISNSTSWSGGTQIAHNKVLTDVIENSSFRISTLDMTSNTAPTPYRILTDYNDIEELDFYIRETATFPYKLLTLPAGSTIESIDVDIITPAGDSFESEGIVSAGDMNSIETNRSMIDNTVVLDTGRELMRVGFYTTTATNLCFSVWETSFSNWSPWEVRLETALVTGTHLGNGAQYFDLPAPWSIPTNHGNLLLGVNAFSDLYLGKCLQSSSGKYVFQHYRIYFPGQPNQQNALVALGTYSDVRLCIQASYRARFSVGYDSSHKDFFVPYFTAASGTSVPQQGSFGPYSTDKDLNVYFSGDTLNSVNLKVTIKKKRDLYRAVDGDLSNRVDLDDIVIDMGQQNTFDSYRFLSGQTISGVSWNVFGSNELPYWESISGSAHVGTLISGCFTDMCTLPPDYQYYAIKFGDRVNISELQFANTLSLTSGVSCVASSELNEWQFDNVARIASISVDSHEPEGTNIYHLVTFDHGESYRYFDSYSWIPVIQNISGQWSYYDGSWNSPTENTKFSALRSLVDNGQYIFSSIELEQVEESEWHVEGGLTSVSGSIGLIQYLKGSGTITPRVDSYSVYYIPRVDSNDQSWFTSQVPSGYGYTKLTQSGVGNNITIPYRIDSGYEYIYGRKETSKFRLYLANPSTSGIPISELAMLNVQLPDHAYYTPPFTSLAHLCPIMSSGNQVPELHDEHVVTGGILIPEKSTLDYEIQNIPPELGLYTGELRVYFDSSLDRPELISVAPSTELLVGTYRPTRNNTEFPLTGRQNANHPFDYAFDDNPDTYASASTVWMIWVPNTYDMLFDIHFKMQNVNIIRFRFKQTNSASLPARLHVEGSNDYTNWTRTATHDYDIYHPPGNYQWGEWRNTNTTAKYVYWRFRVESSMSYYYNGSTFSHGIQIAECELETNSESISYLPANASGISFSPTYTLYDNYYSVLFLASHTLDNLSVRLANGNTTGSGLVRPTELAIFSFDSTSGWDIPDEFNHLESADTKNYSISYPVTNSGIPWVSLTDYASPAPLHVYERIIKLNNGAWHVFEPSTTLWQCDLSEYPWYVTLDTGDPSKGYRVNSYRIKASYNSLYWSSGWTLAGSNDNSTWIPVDTRSSVSWPGSDTWTSYFNVAFPDYFRYYKLTFTQLTSYGLWIEQVDYRYDSWTPMLGKQQPLSTPTMERLFNTSISGAIPLLPNHYIGLESTLTRFGAKSQEIRIYSDSNTSLNVTMETQSSGSLTWVSQQTSWSGDGYFYSNLGLDTVTACRISCSNLSPTDMRWLRAVQLINYGEEIDFGATGSGSQILNLPTVYARYDQMKIYNNNRSESYADARVLPRFSNNYHLDRLALISEDQNNWSHLDTGINLPEDYEFSLGKFVNTEMSGDNIKLRDATTSGHWISPVIEVLDPSSTAAYVYCKNIAYSESYVNKDFVSVMNVVEVRSSNTKPLQTFLVTGVDTSVGDGLQYPWKMVCFNSDGTDATWNTDGSQFDPGKLERGTLTQANDSPRRYWPYTTRFPLWQFYGFIDARRYGSITLGQEYGGSFTVTEDGYYRGEDWYTNYNIWPYGVSRGSTDPPRSQYIHKYPRTNAFLYPIFNQALRYTMRLEGGVSKGSFHFVDAVLRTQPFYERFQEDYYSDQFFHLRNVYTFRGNATTPEKESEIDYLYSFPGQVEAFYDDAVRFGACIDNHSDSFSYWAHYAHEYESSNYYKTLLITEEKVEKEFDNIELKFNYVVEGSYSAPRGFWGLAERAVYWIEYDGNDLVVRYTVTTDALGKGFKLVTFGHTDYHNNLWFVDLVTERVIRINFEDLTLGLQSVDYTRAIDGAVSVYPDPYDGSAYVYVIRDPEFPTNDCLKIVHVGDYDYIVPETVCIVPGVPLIESYNINLYGRSTFPHGYYDVLPTDPVWVDNGTAKWERYSAGSPTLPKGHYKQFKVTLRRRDLASLSPEVEYIRIPKPALLNKIPWKGYRDIFIDTLPRQSEIELASGDYTLDLLIWWPRE